MITNYYLGKGIYLKQTRNLNEKIIVYAIYINIKTRIPVYRNTKYPTKSEKNSFTSLCTIIIAIATRIATSKVKLGTDNKRNLHLSQSAR